MYSTTLLRSAKPDQSRFRLLLAAAICLLPLLSLASNETEAEPSASIVGCPDEHAETVNAVLGDLSWACAFGGTPTDQAPEILRIQIHLSFVEAMLRAVDTKDMPAALRAKREQHLDRLHAYWQAGVFPINTEHRGRRPIFVDAEGRLCAVGYLVAEDAGLPLANAIDAQHHADYVLGMDNEIVSNWVANSGLTPMECAMIQPAYGWQEEESTLTNKYSIGTAIWSMGNGVFAGLNTAGFIQDEGSLGWGIAGIALGLGQIGYGAAKAPVVYYQCFVGPCPVDNEAHMAWTNIGVGSVATISAILRLTRGKRKPSATTWDLAPVSNPAGDGVALRMGYRF